MLVIDHVIYGVRDLDEASRRVADEYGLPVSPGGVHPGGTKNTAVLCRDRSYVELLAATGPSSAEWLQRLISDGDRLIAWAVRTEDIDAVAARLGLDVADGSIEMPDGTIGTWRSAAAPRNEPSLPFVIQYGESRSEPRMDLPDGAPDGIAWVEVGGDAARVAEWLGGADIDVRVTDAPPGVYAVAVRTTSGEIVIR